MQLISWLFFLTSADFDSKVHCPSKSFMQISMDIWAVKLFHSCQRIQSGQTFPLFCISKLIRNFFNQNCYLCTLLHTPNLQSRLKLCSKETKRSVFDPYARPITKPDLIRYFFTNTVTKNQKGDHRSFPFLELNLDL